MADQSAEQALLSELEDIVETAGMQAEAEDEAKRKDIACIAGRFGITMEQAWRAYHRYLRLLTHQPPSNGFAHPVHDDIRRVLLGVAIGIELVVTGRQAKP